MLPDTYNTGWASAFVAVAVAVAVCVKDLWECLWVFNAKSFLNNVFWVKIYKKKKETTTTQKWTQIVKTKNYKKNKNKKQKYSIKTLKKKIK